MTFNSCKVIFISLNKIPLVLDKKLNEIEIAEINKAKTDFAHIPKHISIIMDGNGRWAKNLGLPRVAGHHKGVETVREIVETCSILNVEYLTIYTFSTENWKRPIDEVNTLMRLIVKSLHTETNELHKNNVKLTAIGDLESLPAIVREELISAFEKTKNNTGLNLNLALSYSGRWEITEAVKKIVSECQEHNLIVKDITSETISTFLQTNKMPDPELLIRSGGEYRISNFLLWQSAYSEIYVTKTLWPDFGYKDLLEAIADYNKRERRFGMVSEQLENNLDADNDKKNFKHIS